MFDDLSTPKREAFTNRYSADKFQAEDSKTHFFLGDRNNIDLVA